MTEEDRKRGERRGPDYEIQESEDWFFIESCVATLITSLQVAVFALKTAAHEGNSYPEWLADILNHLDWLYFDIDGDGYITLFLIISGFVTVFTLTAILSQCGCDIFEALRDSCMVHENVFVKVFKGIVYGVLFLPIVKIMFQMFDCQHGVLVRNYEMRCWEGDHTGYAIWAALTILVLALGATIRAYFRDRESHYEGDPATVKKTVYMYEAKVNLLKLVTVLFGLFIDDKKAALALMFVLSLGPLVYIPVKLPFIELRYNCLQAARFSSETWSYFCAMVAASVSSDDYNAGALVLIGVVVSTVVMTYVVMVINRSRRGTRADLASMSEAGLWKNEVKLNEEQRLAKSKNLDENRVLVFQFEANNDLMQFLVNNESRADLEGISLMLKDDVIVPGLDGSVLGLIADFISCSPGLKYFCLNGHSMNTVKEVQILLSELEKLQELREINLYKCNISDEGARLLVKDLVVISSLRTLNLAENNIKSQTRLYFMDLKETDDKYSKIRFIFG